MTSMAAKGLMEHSFPRHIFNQEPGKVVSQATVTSRKLPGQMQPTTHPQEPPKTSTDVRKPLAPQDTNKPSGTLRSPFKPTTNPQQYPRTTKPTLHPASARNPLAPNSAGIGKSRPSTRQPLADSKYTNVSIKSAPPRAYRHCYGSSPLKTKHAHPARQTRTVSPAKKLKTPVKRPDHPLFAAFKGAAQTYTSHTTTHLPTLLTNTLTALTSALHNTHLISQIHLTRSITRDATVYRPFHEEGLLISESKAGTKTRTTVGARVGDFEKVVEREGKVLSGLWGRWGDVVQGLRALGEGLILGDGKGENGGGGKDSEVDGGEGYAAKYRELDTAYKTKRAGILEQYEDACEELVQGVRKDEKEYEKKRKEQRNKFMAFMEEQLAELGEGDGDEVEEVE